MLYLTHLLPRSAVATLSITLTFDQRRKTRLRLRLGSAAEAALLLPRGTVLRDGDKIGADDGSVVEVRAAPEELSTVTTDDPLLLTRVAYHLGNRHVPLSIEEHRISYAHDHVLDDLVRQLGLEVLVIQAPFEPEAGSYSHEHQRHGAQHDHPHDTHAHHDHQHRHDHGHHRHTARR